MEYATLITEIRARLGNPSESVLSNDSIHYSIESALSELSRLQPYYVYEELNMVKGVSNYELGASIIDVRSFWFTPNYVNSVHREWMALTGAEGIPAIDGYSEYVGLKVFHSPSLMNILEEKWDRLRSRQLLSWEFNPDTNILMVIPAPKESGKSIYKGTLKRDISTVSAKYEGAFKDLARALSMEAWCLKLALIKSIPVGVGKVDYDTDSLRKASSGLREEALRKLIGGGSGVAIG